MYLKSTLFAVTMLAAGIRLAGAWFVGFGDVNNDHIPKSGGQDNHCYNMNDLGYGDWNDKVTYAFINDASCVFWADTDCSGAHTKTEIGAAGTGFVDFGGVCTGHGQWTSRISSFKCCGGKNYCNGNPGCT